MTTKREILESFVLNGSCEIEPDCSLCQYKNTKACNNRSLLRARLTRIGAMAILRQNRKKREFDPDKILTCVTADKAKVGMKGYFGDDLVGLKSSFERNFVQELLNIQGERFSHRFHNVINVYALFYPIDEEVK